MYSIKDGYVENPRPCYFLDDVTTTRGIIYQPDVYVYAENIAVELGVSKLIDFGCGWGNKLAMIHERHPDWHIVGVDFGENIKHCRATYSWGEWIEQNLDRPTRFDVRPELRGAVAVSADVVEHLARPENLVRTILKFEPTRIVLSTPEREVLYGEAHNGPPPNLCHIREWNQREFVSFLEAEGLTVLEQMLTRGDDVANDVTTQMVLATG
jgi:hypothetical protein